ncbi:hypothetical protein [Dysosmobacter sp.]|jgi:hypothetical protein|nr:hypothetical protein [Dysosmobacter sp.]
MDREEVLKQAQAQAQAGKSADGCSVCRRIGRKFDSSLDEVVLWMSS